MNIREKILNADDIGVETLYIERWGVTVQIREADGAARSAMLEKAIDSTTGGMKIQNIYPDLIIASTYDPETGEPVFNDDDRAVLMTKASGPLDEIAKIAMRLSGFNDDSVDRAGKDSSNTQSDDSNTS